MKDEGLIKFNFTWIKAPPFDDDLVKDINSWRDKLYESGLIGVNDDGVGYGNISQRFHQNTFIITGSGTGKIRHLANEHYTLVTNYDLEENTLTAKGPVVASSESLTHAMIYETQSNMNVVMHVHHLDLWRYLLNAHLSTNSTAEYGTTGMAKEIKRLFQETDIEMQKIFAMAGHESGIISFGKDFEQAGQAIFDELARL